MNVFAKSHCSEGCLEPRVTKDSEAASARWALAVPGRGVRAEAVLGPGSQTPGGLHVHRASHLPGLFSCLLLLCQAQHTGMWPDGREGPRSHPCEVTTEGSGHPRCCWPSPASLPEVTTSQPPSPAFLGPQVLLRHSVQSPYLTDGKGRGPGCCEGHQPPGTETAMA